jgi:hypothetical protein
MNKLITNSTKQSPSSEANSYLFDQEIPQLLRKPKAHHCVHKSLPLIPVQGQITSFYTISFRYILLLSSHLNLSLPRTLFLSNFQTKILYASLNTPTHSTSCGHLTLLHFLYLYKIHTPMTMFFT